MPETVRPLLRKIWSRLGQAGRLVGILALSPLAESADVGRGYHSGASIPMSRSPMGWQSDTLGRPRGLKRIHVADASVLPEIPSGPVTLTIMANAHRIAHEAATLDRS
jgi:choline dehydrogenase-like flavoprotein